jgi:hypothetical protein
MFSVNNFYDYLIHHYSWPQESNNLVYKFQIDGSRDLSTLRPSTNLPADVRPQSLGALFQFDQEPFFFDYYSFNYKHYNYPSHHLFTHQENILNNLSRIYTPIICHSELKSEEISLFRNAGFLDVHYWWHGIISQDWFRNFKYYKIQNVKNKKRFGLYARDATGSRTYRVALLKRLSNLNENVHFEFQPEIFQVCDQEIQQKWPLSSTYYSSDSSAVIDWNDTERFNIHLVAETIFNTKKTHLTEKILKPIVMGQPFILFSSPNSLSYIKQYGFKTFNRLWDESYDTILGHDERFENIIKLIKSINSLGDYEFRQLMDQALLIAEYNRKHFFSEKFQKILLNELHDNLNNAINIQKEQFFTEPGGPLFKYYNEAFYRNDKKCVPTHREISTEIVTYIKQSYPLVATQITKTYPHLF